MLEKIKQLFSEPDSDEIFAYQYKIPNSIKVEVDKHNGCYYARVESINDEPLDASTFMTESRSIIELISEVNDMLLDYLDFPDNIKSKMPQLLPPAEFLEQEGAILNNGTSRELVFAK